MRACVLSGVQLFSTPWTIAHQAPLSIEFSRQEYWSGLPFSTPEDLPDPEIEPKSLASPALAVDSLPLHHLGSPYKVSQVQLFSITTSVSFSSYCLTFVLILSLWLSARLKVLGEPVL